MIYSVRCIIEMKTPLHCGEQTDGILDAPVTHDPFGFWRIPASSIAGVFRSYVHEYFPKHENKLFGSNEYNALAASSIWFSDAVLLDYDHKFAWKKIFDGQKPEIYSHSYIRDHVAIDLDLGSSVQGGKFDEEYVPAGSRFAFEFTLDGWMQKVDPELVQIFAAVINGFKNGAMQFGAHTSYDYGTYKVVELQTRQFDLTKPKEAEQWLQLTEAPLFPKDLGKPFDYQGAAKEQAKDCLYGTIDLPLRTTGPILIAGGNPSGSIDADLCFARTAILNYGQHQVEDHLIIPGSAIRGCLRHRIYQILQSQNVDDPLSRLQDIFGSTDSEKITRGKIGVADAELFSAKKNSDLEDCKIVQHVSIDRFTGGAMDSHLFNEAPLWQKETSFVVHLRLLGLAPQNAALLLHALIDLAEGKLAIGNGVRRGNGQVHLDPNTPLACDLTWNGEKLTANDHAKAKEWLAKIAKA